MREGWHGGDYLVLFDESEVAVASAPYEMSQFLPGFKVLGLLSWDDSIVRNLSKTHRFRRAVFTVGAQCVAPTRRNAGQTATGPRVVPL